MACSSEKQCKQTLILREKRLDYIGREKINENRGKSFWLVKKLGSEILDNSRWGDESRNEEKGRKTCTLQINYKNQLQKLHT